MDIDKNDVLKKAEELLNENKEKGIGEDIEVSEMEKQQGSYDDEKLNFESDEGGSNGIFEEEEDSPRKILGYKREPQYKPPSLLKFTLAFILLVLLGILIGLMLPYVPPVLS